MLYNMIEMIIKVYQNKLHHSSEDIVTAVKTSDLTA